MMCPYNRLAGILFFLKTAVLEPVLAEKHGSTFVLCHFSHPHAQLLDFTIGRVHVVVSLGVSHRNMGTSYPAHQSDDTI